MVVSPHSSPEGCAASPARGSGAAGQRPLVEAAALARRAVALGADGAAALAAADIVTAEWVAIKCRFGCPKYGRQRTCPPFTPAVDEFRKVLAAYQSALLVWVEPRGGEDLAHSRRRLHESVLALEREAFLGGGFKAFGLVDGTCLCCADDEPCTPEACRHPEQVRPSLAGCGVDAFATAAAAGVEMRVVREKAETYRLLGMVLIA